MISPAPPNQNQMRAGQRETKGPNNWDFSVHLQIGSSASGLSRACLSIRTLACPSSLKTVKKGQRISHICHI